MEVNNLVPRVFVLYCACWLDETSDRWSRGTQTLGTRVGSVMEVYIKASERTGEEGEKGTPACKDAVGSALIEILSQLGSKNHYHANLTAGVFAESRTTLKFSV